MLLVPDNHPHYKVESGWPYMFFGSGGVPAFGMWIRACSNNKGGVPPMPQDYDAERTANVRLDGFLSQRVLCPDSKWVSRRDVIKYVANVASGVHSSEPNTDEDKTLARVRSSATYRVGTYQTGDALTINFNIDGLSPPGATFKYEPEDPILLELLASAHFLVQSPSVVELERLILKEIS